MGLKHKYLFFCSKLEGGGAERHLVRILNAADFNLYEIHLALTRGGGNYEKELNEKVQKHYLTSVSSSTRALVSSYFPLKRLINLLEPDLIMSVMDRQNILLSLVKRFNKNIPSTVVCCQNAVKTSLSNSGIIGSLFKNRITKLYNQHNAIVAISEGVKSELINEFGITTPIKRIYNAGFDEEKILKSTVYQNKNPDTVYLLAVGRLTKQKGFDTLFKSIKQVKNVDKLHLWLLGQGPDEPKLKALLKELDIEDKVTFFGFQSNPYLYFKAADIFVLSSRWEGFGNVITEAMASECPVISTDCNYGPGEIITNNKNGLLVPVEDENRLANAIETLAENKEKRLEIAQNGLIRSKDFTADTISYTYFKFFNNVLNE